MAQIPQMTIIICSFRIIVSIQQRLLIVISISISHSSMVRRSEASYPPIKSKSWLLAYDMAITAKVTMLIIKHHNTTWEGCERWWLCGGGGFMGE